MEALVAEADGLSVELSLLLQCLEMWDTHVAFIQAGLQTSAFVAQMQRIFFRKTLPPRMKTPCSNTIKAASWSVLDFFSVYLIYSKTDHVACFLY
jgi:hypothetical protein